MKKLAYQVFPSEEQTIFVEEDNYGGAHKYLAKKSKGYNNDQVEYVEETAELQFVFKGDDGVLIPGWQNEQLAYVLLDRIQKMNARFPDENNKTMIAALETFISASRKRAEERINRKVMGKLKN